MASMLQSVQTNMMNLLQDLKDSMVILGTIFIFIFFYAMVCYFIY
jgi:hypothetical protein